MYEIPYIKSNPSPVNIKTETNNINDISINLIHQAKIITSYKKNTSHYNLVLIEFIKQSAMVPERTVIPLQRFEKIRFTTEKVKK